MNTTILRCLLVGEGVGDGKPDDREGRGKFVSVAGTLRDKMYYRN